MGLYADQLLPRFIDVALGGRSFDRLRERTASGLSGEVLEIGFGSGRNVPHLPASVTRVLAVDPAVVGRRLAAGRVARRGIPVDFVGLDGARLPIEDESVDHVLSTWTLCTIPDVDAALAEVHRVLKPGGSLRFLEHGRATEPTVQRWQDRLTPLQRRAFGGCHLNRSIGELVASSGLEVTSHENYYLRGPKAMGFMYEGVAVKS